LASTLTPASAAWNAAAGAAFLIPARGRLGLAQEQIAGPLVNLDQPADQLPETPVVLKRRSMALRAAFGTATVRFLTLPERWASEPGRMSPTAAS